MIDIKLLRENLDVIKKGVERKKFDIDFAPIIALDKKRREQMSEAENARAAQKAANEGMAALEKGSDEFKSKIAEMKIISGKVKELESAAKLIEEEWKKLIMGIPNVPHESVPEGKSEDDNQVAATWGNPEDASPDAKPHYDIPWFSKVVDFERGVKVTGAGFPFYVGDMARLQRALIQFCLNEAHGAGYEEVIPPLVVNEESAIATGQLPDKEGQMYVVPENGLYLIPTAEVPITNFYRDEILEEDDLPLCRCGYTPCFRREAGSWGKHVRGLNRLHQFDKVELVKWTLPDDSFDELEKLREDAERLLQKLGLPYRTLLMCAGEIGFPHAKQYDLEVWAAGQKSWLEVSSCSNFTDFQARRAGIRFRPSGGGKPEMVHTLNGSALGLPRVMVAILENNLQADGTVLIPEVLRPLYGGDVIGEG